MSHAVAPVPVPAARSADRPLPIGRARVDAALGLSVAVAPLTLFLVALAVRWWAAAQVDFAPTENSAYYVGVARNVVEGRGLVTDSMWSYATPPLVFPKPAFELWMPLASLIAAVPMALFGTTLAVAQLSSLLMGAAVAPLAWAIARDAARRHGLDERRIAGVAFTTGLGVALSAPLITAAMGPDSSTPFTVLVLVGCLLMPGALAGRLRPAIGLGAAMGLAYLARQEALELGLTLLLLLVVAVRRVPAARRVPLLARALGVPVLIGALVVLPWLARNLSAFGTLFPGQALENAYLTANEQIFAYAHRPTATLFLAQGPAVIVGNIVEALRTNLVDALVMPAAPLTLVALVAAPFLRRSPSLRQTSPLVVALLSGTLTFLVTSVLFPVATRWGTFLHASGPLLVGLIVLAALGLDAVVVRVGRWRGWPKPNVLLPALFVIGLGLPLAVFQVRILATQTATARDDVRALASWLATQPELADRSRPILTDHPIWLAELTGRPAMALPDEAPDEVWGLAARFDAPLVALIDERGRYPDAFASAPGTDPASATCFVERSAVQERFRVFLATPACAPR